MSGALTGGVLAARGGAKAAAVSAVVGGSLLAMIQGIAALQFRDYGRAKQSSNA